MNFTGEHPLNLISKVAVVTCSSSPTGAAICRALLNSNAFVLGIDRDVPHHSTRSSRASHFQFLRMEEEGSVFLSGEIAKSVQGKFGRGKVDYLINVAGEADWKEDWEGVLGVLESMAATGKGLVLNVITSGKAEKEIVSPSTPQSQARETNQAGRLTQMQIASAKAACAKCEGVRYNVLVAHDVGSEASEDMLDEATKNALREHMKEHEVKRKEGGYEKEQERDLANLALFLCTAQAEGVKDAIVGIDGTFGPL